MSAGCAFVHACCDLLSKSTCLARVAYSLKKHEKRHVTKTRATDSSSQTIFFLTAFYVRSEQGVVVMVLTPPQAEKEEGKGSVTAHASKQVWGGFSFKPIPNTASSRLNFPKQQHQQHTNAHRTYV